MLMPITFIQLVFIWNRDRAFVVKKSVLSSFRYSATSFTPEIWGCMFLYMAMNDPR